MAANIPWYRQKRMSGRKEEPFGWASVFMRPN